MFGVPVPPCTGDEVADAAAFAAWELARERHYYPDRFGPAGERLPEPRRLEYFVGVPEPSWLNHADGVPKFISAARLDRLVSREERWPVTCVDPWAIDSGAYIALDQENTRTPWWLPAEIYASKILSFATDSGRPPDFVAPQDWPCEPGVRQKTGLTVREHQKLTLENYLFLVEEWPWLPWIPVLQGWEPGEHLEHAAMYADAGVDLASCHRVGIGSVCRRAHLPEIVEVIEQFADAGLKLHGFGVKKTALPVIGHLLASADSMAWSFDARRTPVRMPGCTHTNCASCYRYAKHWREQVLASLTEGKTAMPATRKPSKRRPKAAAPVDLLSGLEELFATAEEAGTVALTDVQIGQYVSVTGANAHWIGAANGTLGVPQPKEKAEVRGYLVKRLVWKGGVKLGAADMKFESAAAGLVALADHPDVDWLLNGNRTRLVYLPVGARAKLVDEPDEVVREDDSAKAWMTASLVSRAEGILATVHPGENMTWAAAVIAATEAWQIKTVFDGHEQMPCAGGGRVIKGWQRPMGYVERWLTVSPKADAIQVLTEKGGEVLAEVTGRQIRDLLLDVAHFVPSLVEELLHVVQELEEAMEADKVAQRKNGGAGGAVQRQAYRRMRLAADACYELADQFWQEAETVMAIRIAGGDVDVQPPPSAPLPVEGAAPEPVVASVPAQREPATAAAAVLDLDAVEEAVDAELLQLELDLGDLFASTVPEPTTVPERDVVAEAYEVLETYRKGVTPQRLAQWAAGVVTMRHALNLVSWWNRGEVRLTESQHVAEGQAWRADGKGFALAARGSGDTMVQRPVFKTVWPTVMKLVDESKVPAHLVARVRAAMAERRDATVPYDPMGARSKTDPGGHAAAQARWEAADREAYAAAEAVWAAVKPE